MSIVAQAFIAFGVIAVFATPAILRFAMGRAERFLSRGGEKEAPDE